MSVIQNSGVFQQKRLSKIYSDTKQSYEKAVLAPKGHEDPKLKLLRDNFQIQQDRLYAWCVAWTEHAEYRYDGSKKGGPFNQASNTEHAAEVMNTIKSILDQYRNSQEQSDGGDRPESKSLKRKAQSIEETCETIASLQSDLTTCIDTLFVLSNYRHEGASDLKHEPAANASTLHHYDMIKKRYPSGEDISKKLEEQFSTIQKGWSQAPTSLHRFDFGNPSVPQNENVEQFSIEASVSQHLLYFDRRALELAPGHQSDLLNPPPYEAAVAPSHTRVVGRLTSTGLSPEQIAAFLPENMSSIPVSVELVPVQSRGRGGTIALPQQKIEVLAQHLEAIIKRAKTSHVGFFRFLGYFIDIEFSQIAFVYQLPFGALDENSFMAYHGPSKPRSLLSLISTATDGSDPRTPNLEDRFRMAYNLVLGIMHLRSHNLVHGAVNSSNITTLQSDLSSSRGGVLDANIREPFLTSFAQLSDHISNKFDESLHTSIYRHPADSRSVTDDRAWTYDLYSLGLILLEIGFWTPLTHLWKAKYDNATFMSRIKKVYLQKLGSRCSSAYMQVVQKCLSAPEWYSLEVERSSTVLQDQCMSRSKSYTLDILHDIARCCSIDIHGPATDPDLAYFETFQTSQLPAVEKLSQVHQTDRLSHDTLPDAPMTPQSLTEDFEASRLVDETPIARKSVSSLTAKATVLRKWDGVEIPQEDLDEWNTYLMPRLGKFLQRALGGSLESSSASLMMVGPSRETARTTICVQCTSVDVVKAALKQGFRCKKGWGLIVVKGEVRRSKHRRRRKRRPGQPPKDVQSTVPDLQRVDSFYQERPQIGASIGAFRDNAHLPPVSFGGTILVDGQPFGLTVHHMLDAPSDDEDETLTGPGKDDAKRSVGTYSIPSVTDDESYWDEYSLPEALYPFEIADDDNDAILANPQAHEGKEIYSRHSFLYDDPGMEYDLDTDSDFDDSMSVGDTVGIDPEDEEELMITQPAIDDVEDDFFPNSEDRDDDHLSSHLLGYVYASSGLRRVKTQGTTHEIDWALIKIADERLNLENIMSQEDHVALISGGECHLAGEDKAGRNIRGSAERPEPLRLNGIAESEDLGGREVQGRGRTSGLHKGSISKAMELVRIQGRRSYSSTWVVEGGFGVPGDSGAWVCDPSTGQLCGHVLAWSDRFQRAYIAPMEVLFRDITRSLGATDVSLPLMGNRHATRQLGQVTQEAERATLPRSTSAGTAPAEGRGIEVSLDSLSISGGSDAEQSRSFVPHIASSFQNTNGMMHVAGAMGGQVV